MKTILHSIFPLILTASSLAGEAKNITDNWMATDALGRKLPTHAEVGERRPGKQVGVFYFVWNGNHTQKVYDISKILQQPESERKWGPKHATHFGSEPEVGYFHSSDPWLIRRDMQMLANAGVDFIYLDVTNNLLYEKSVDQLLKVIQKMRIEGIHAPQVCFLTNAASGRCMNVLHDRYYNKAKFNGLWFQWEGRPLILGKVDDPVLRKDVAQFFTIKRSWAWTKAKTTANEWQWLDTWPQDFGWSQSPDSPDQISVSAGSHASNSKGKSYSYKTGKHPPVLQNYTTKDTHRGLFFEEQWQRAHEVDPKVIMITQWNEWIAMRFIKKGQTKIYAGRPPMKDGTWFVDVFTPEFSRDIAPMRGGYTDNYYYQMAGNIRRFKGISAPAARPKSCEIKIDGKFDDWNKIPPTYQDPPGDTMHRSFRGTDPATIYTNTFGRNDILSARVVESNDHVHFMISAAADLTPHTDPHWMTLLIDSDQNKSTGWQGYDLAINWKAASNTNTETNCAKWINGQWKISAQISMAYHGKQLELSIPDSFFPRKPQQGFDFKWADNVNLKSVESLFLQGDVAPDRRFNFRY